MPTLIVGAVCHTTIAGLEFAGRKKRIVSTCRALFGRFAWYWRRKGFAGVKGSSRRMCAHNVNTKILSYKTRDGGAVLRGRGRVATKDVGETNRGVCREVDEPPDRVTRGRKERSAAVGGWRRWRRRAGVRGQTPSRRDIVRRFVLLPLRVTFTVCVCVYMPK